MSKGKSPRAFAPAIKRTPISAISPEEQIVGALFIGKVSSYNGQHHTMRIKLEEAVSMGDLLRVKGANTDLSQRVERLLVKSKCAQSALAGEVAEIEIISSVRAGDAVYKVRGSRG